MFEITVFEQTLAVVFLLAMAVFLLVNRVSVKDTARWVAGVVAAVLAVVLIFPGV